MQAQRRAPARPARPAPPKAPPLALAPPRAPTPRAPAQISAPERYVATAEGDALSPDLLDRLNDTRALAVRAATPAQRPYSKDDLYAVAEIAYHYLFAGAVPIASVLYEGVTAICPNEPAFWLGLGLCADRLGDKQKARANYARAAALDPADPRADINLAELFLEENDLPRARAHLARAVKKADVKSDRTLGAKARAILGLIG